MDVEALPALLPGLRPRDAGFDAWAAGIEEAPEELWNGTLEAGVATIGAWSARGSSRWSPTARRGALSWRTSATRRGRRRCFSAAPWRPACASGARRTLSCSRCSTARLRGGSAVLEACELIRDEDEAQRELAALVLTRAGAFVAASVY